MAVVVQRTGQKSFNATNDDSTEMWYEADADYSTTPPTITLKMRFLTKQDETWDEVNYLLTNLFGA